MLHSISRTNKKQGLSFRHREGEEKEKGEVRRLLCFVVVVVLLMSIYTRILTVSS